MSKLLEHPVQCKYRNQIFTLLGLPTGNYTCNNPNSNHGTLGCQLPDVFPAMCPLEDGLPKSSIHWP